MTYLSQNRKTIQNAILIISVIGLITIFWLDRLIIVDTIKKENLEDLNSLFSTLSFIVSVITIYLLYINYRQSQEEFHKLNEANRLGNVELVRSNELVILNSELEYLTSELNRKIFSYNNKKLDNHFIDFHEFVHNIVFVYNDEPFYERNIKNNANQLYIILNLIEVTERNLKTLIKHIDSPTLFLVNRLPTDIEVLVSRIKNLVIEKPDFEDEKIRRILTYLEIIRKFIDPLKYKAESI